MLNGSWLEQQYLIRGKTRKDIANETGLTPGRVGNLLQEFGIKRYSVKRHGLYKHPLNAVWCGIKERCFNHNASNYRWYGANGISLCDEWMDFLPFYNWAMNNGWEPGLTVDRIDPAKEYSPNNCRLVPFKQQCRNRRSNVWIEVDGEKHLQCEWEEILGLRSKCIAQWKSKYGIEYVVGRLRKEKEVARKDNR